MLLNPRIYVKKVAKIAFAPPRTGSRYRAHHTAPYNEILAASLLNN